MNQVVTRVDMASARVQKLGEALLSESWDDARKLALGLAYDGNVKGMVVMGALHTTAMEPIQALAWLDVAAHFMDPGKCGEKLHACIWGNGGEASAELERAKDLSQKSGIALTDEQIAEAQLLKLTLQADIECRIIGL